MTARFRLAPMSRVIAILSGALLALPVGLALGAWRLDRPALGVPALLAVALYSWIWLRFRPTMFVVHDDRIEVVWPLKRAWIRRQDIVDARLLGWRDLRREIGWGLRLGAGGLWGAFGWLWTRRRGVVQMYISRLDRFVWIERTAQRPWLITPEHPEAFVRAIAPPWVTPGART